MLKQKLLKILYIFTYWAGVNKIFYYLNRKSQRVLTYHNIIPEQYYDEKLLHLGASHDSEIFKKHISFILTRLEITLKLGKERSCLITFDDGFENNFSEACAVLKHFNVKAFFFVPIDMTIHGNLLWIDKILMWFSYVPEGKYLIDGTPIGIIDNDSRRHSFIKIWRLLLKNHHLKKNILKSLDENFPFNSLKIDPMLYKIRFTAISLKDIEKMKSDGHKIGCHSLYHDILACLNDKELNMDIQISETYLEKLYNTKIYSYPFGGEKEVSDKVIKRVGNSKFTHAFLNLSKPNFPFSRYALPRLSLPNSDDKYRLDAILSGVEYFIKYRKLLPIIKEFT